MAKVNPHHVTSFKIDHEVGEMPVTDAEDVLTDADDGMGRRQSTSQDMEGFRRCAHLMECTSGQDKESYRSIQITHVINLENLQQSVNSVRSRKIR